MLSLYRRHLKKCPHRAKSTTGKHCKDRNEGAAFIKCSCPIWCSGKLNGEPVRESLETRDWQRAIRKLAALEDPKAPRVKAVAEAITAFENHTLSLQSGTQRKYKNVLAQLRAYCHRAGVGDVMQVTVEQLESLGGKEVRVFLRLLVNDRKENLTIPFKVANVEY
jgi:hypothetical protein